MNHQALVRSFRDKLKRSLKIPIHFYKIPDTRGLGGKRPYDGYFVINGVFFAFEAKTKRDSLKPHQTYYLNDVQKCGGVSLLVEEGKADQVINNVLLVLGSMSLKK